jgi:general secretion pathway protein G
MTNTRRFRIGLIVAVAVLLVAGTIKYQLGSGFWVPATSVSQLFAERVGDLLEKFRRDVGRYPTSAEGLQVLIETPQSEVDRAKWRGPYIEVTAMPNDPWLRPYIYRYPSERSSKAFDLFSMGPDGTISSDDIGNW